MNCAYTLPYSSKGFLILDILKRPSAKINSWASFLQKYITIINDRMPAYTHEIQLSLHHECIS